MLSSQDSEGCRALDAYTPPPLKNTPPPPVATTPPQPQPRSRRPPHRPPLWKWCPPSTPMPRPSDLAQGPRLGLAVCCRPASPTHPLRRSRRGPPPPRIPTAMPPKVRLPSSPAPGPVPPSHLVQVTSSFMADARYGPLPSMQRPVNQATGGRRHHSMSV
jgi:hypothetical protein